MAVAENCNESPQQEVSLKFADAKEEQVSISEDYGSSNVEALSNTEEAEVNSAYLRIEVDEKAKELSAHSQIKELASQLNGMKVELQSLNIKKSELESQLERQATKAQELQYEKSKLSSRVLELEEISEKSMSESSDLQQELVSLQVQNSYLERRIECISNEGSAQVQDLTELLESERKQVSENLIQIETLKEELARTEAEKRMTEELQVNKLEQRIRIQLRDEKEELHARIFELEGIVTAREKDISNLQKKNKISDQPRNQPEYARSSLISENISKFNKFSDQAKESGDKLNSSRSLINNGKFIKNAEESTNKVSPKDLNLKVCQAAQRKMDELAEEFRKHVEDKMRLLSQRIRVLEQLHAENSSSHKIMHETLEQENKLLEAKVTSYEAQLKKLKGLHEAAETTIKGLEFMVSKLEAGNKDLDRMANLLDELQLAKKWIQLKSEYIRQLGYSLESVNAQLDEKQEMIGKLEARVGHLEHEVEERDQELGFLGEEKREVIRQLCVLIDHLREENQHLKEIIAKLKATKTLAKH